MSVQVKSSGSSPTLQSRTVTPSSSTQYITAQSGYDALSQVTVQGDSNLIESNIKSGVSIFGVSGNVKSMGEKHQVPCTITNFTNTSTVGTFVFSFGTLRSSGFIAESINASTTAFFILNLCDTTSSGDYYIQMNGGFAYSSYNSSRGYYVFRGEDGTFMIVKDITGTNQNVVYWNSQFERVYLYDNGTRGEVDISYYSEWKSYYSSVQTNVTTAKNIFYY